MVQGGAQDLCVYVCVCECVWLSRNNNSDASKSAHNNQGNSCCNLANNNQTPATPMPLLLPLEAETQSA